MCLIPEARKLHVMNRKLLVDRRRSWDGDKRFFWLASQSSGSVTSTFCRFGMGTWKERTRNGRRWNCSTVDHVRWTPSGTFKRNGRDIIHLTAADIHNSDSEMTSDDQSPSVGGSPLPPTHSLWRNSHVMYHPNHYHPFAWEHLEKGDVVGYNN